MERAAPKRAFAAREAHEALVELRKLVEEAASTTHAAELESFHLACCQGEDTDVRSKLRKVAERLQSADEKLSQVREKLQMAASA